MPPAKIQFSGVHFKSKEKFRIGTGEFLVVHCNWSEVILFMRGVQPGKIPGHTPHMNRITSHLNSSVRPEITTI